MIAAAALMFLIAPALKAEEAGGAALIPAFQIAQAEAQDSGKSDDANPCAMMGEGKGCSMGDGKSCSMGDGKSCSMMGGDKSCSMGDGKNCSMDDGKSCCMGDGKGCAMMGEGKGCAMMGEGKGCPMMGKGKHRNYKKMEPGMRAAHLDEKLASLKTALNIRKDQEAAFDGFAKALHARVKPTEEMHATLMKRMQGKDKPGALERLELREKKIAVRHKNVLVVRQALGNLFKALDKDQKKQADELFAQHRFRRLP